MHYKLQEKGFVRRSGSQPSPVLGATSRQCLLSLSLLAHLLLLCLAFLSHSFLFLSAEVESSLGQASASPEGFLAAHLPCTAFVLSGEERPFRMVLI